jgi:hypothetical protein
LGRETDSPVEGDGFELLVPPGRRWAGAEHFLKDACGEAARLGVEPLQYTAGLETSSIAAAASVWFRAAGHLADRSLGGY